MTDVTRGVQRVYSPKKKGFFKQLFSQWQLALMSVPMLLYVLLFNYAPMWGWINAFTFTSYFHKKMPQSFHGTGDIFASVLTGALMRGLSLQKSYSLAADFVVESIKETLSHDNYNWYGVDFEAAFPYLIQRLGA